MTAARGLSQKDAAAQVMEAAYMAASANGTLPATARQVMYAARPKIEALTSGRRLDDQYFCQTLLPDFMEEHGVDWDVVFDARGHFIEPHDGEIVNLGTLGVRSYLKDIREAKFEAGEAKFRPHQHARTGLQFWRGAVHRKGRVSAVIRSCRLAEHHDIAIMSTKGVSVTAARLLVDRMCSAHSIPLLVLHDFDVAGFTILDTLRRDTRRYQFESDFEVIDLGLRLADVQAMGLQSEGAASSKSSADAIRARLRNSGATPEECEFLVHQRVELNAMTSEQFVAFIKRKLAEHGVEKIVPSKQTLDKAYQLFERGRRLEEAFDKMATDLETADARAPHDIEKRVSRNLEGAPDASLGCGRQGTGGPRRRRAIMNARSDDLDVAITSGAIVALRKRAAAIRKRAASGVTVINSPFVVVKTSEAALRSRWPLSGASGDLQALRRLGRGRDRSLDCGPHRRAQSRVRLP